jgi:hypothetical protein
MIHLYSNPKQNDPMPNFYGDLVRNLERTSWVE